MRNCGAANATRTARPSAMARSHVERIPQPASEPAADRDLLVRIELERVAAVHLEVAEEAVARAPEREVGHRRRHADVDAHHRRSGAVRELTRGFTARCKN